MIDLSSIPQAAQADQCFDRLLFGALDLEEQNETNSVPKVGVSE
jgi:hypothetical protein